MTRFSDLFAAEKPIIGMIHLSGNRRKDIIGRALEELTIYSEEGVDAAIVEDFHGNEFIKPVNRMREYVEIIRKTVSGENQRKGA